MCLPCVLFSESACGVVHSLDVHMQGFFPRKCFFFFVFSGVLTSMRAVQRFWIILCFLVLLLHLLCVSCFLLGGFCSVVAGGRKDQDVLSTFQGKLAM